MHKKIFLLVLLFFSPLAFAAGPSGGGIPWDFIKLQAINFAVFAGVIFWIAKFKIAPVFNGVKEDYLAKANEAERKLKEAKAERDDLKRKLADLESGFEKALADAKNQAEDRREFKLYETKQQIENMNKDLDSQLDNLKRNYANEIKQLLMEGSVDSLKADLGDNIDEKVLSMLQSKFVNSVEARV